MKIYLNGVEFENFTNFSELINENSTKNTTMDGTLYVDYFNYKRTWNVEWGLIEYSEYQKIIDAYEYQRDNNIFIRFEVPDRGIDRFVNISIPTSKIVFDNQYIDGYEITLTEEQAIS